MRCKAVNYYFLSTDVQQPAENGLIKETTEPVFLVNSQMNYFIFHNNLAASLKLDFFESFKVNDLENMSLADYDLKHLDFLYLEENYKFSPKDIVKASGYWPPTKNHHTFECLARLNAEIEKGLAKLKPDDNKIRLDCMDKFHNFTTELFNFPHSEALGRNSTFLNQLINNFFSLGTLSVEIQIFEAIYKSELIFGYEDENEICESAHIQNLLYFLANICNLASKFYKFDPDSTPFDIFYKFNFVFYVITYCNSSEILDELIEMEYLNFMKIYRDQYRLIYAQFFALQSKVDEKLAIERFLIANSVLDTLYLLITLTCNSFRIGIKDKLKVYEIDFKLIEEMEDYECAFEKDIGITCSNNFDKSEIIKRLKKSILVLSQLPITFIESDQTKGEIRRASE